MKIQPEEGVSIRFNAKVPGPKMHIRGVTMDFNYGTGFGVVSAPAYERLIGDAMRGDATLFTRWDAVECGVGSRDADFAGCTSQAARRRRRSTSAAGWPAGSVGAPPGRTPLPTAMGNRSRSCASARARSGAFKASASTARRPGITAK
jgi:glucose-6-phosphate 1-dehydrogenase